MYQNTKMCCVEKHILIKTVHKKKIGIQIIVGVLISPPARAALLTRSKPSGDVWSNNRFLMHQYSNERLYRPQVICSISLPTKLCPQSQIWYSKWLSYIYAPKAFLRNQCRPNPFCPDRFRNSWENVSESILKARTILIPSFLCHFSVPKHPLCFPAPC